MARPLRIEYPGALYHVTSRGNAREDIFFDEKQNDWGQVLFFARTKSGEAKCKKQDLIII